MAEKKTGNTQQAKRSRVQKQVIFACPHNNEFWERQLKFEQVILKMHHDDKQKFMELFEVYDEESKIINKRIILETHIAALFGIDRNNKDEFGYAINCFHYPHLTWTAKPKELQEFLSAWEKDEPKGKSK